MVAQALENLDAEGRNGLLSLTATDRDEDDSVSEVSNSGVQNIRKELDEYKKLLDEAQMQHFELSKQSRLLIAEKDAEIAYLKQQSPDSANSVGVSSTEGSLESNLLFQKLLSEKKVLETSLTETEEQLRAILHEKNELNVVKKNYKELQERFESVKNDLVSLKGEVEVKERQKNETIDSLVSEYSRLAAETELQQQKSSERILQILRENEVLVTKMHALEHSIAELADRSVASSSSQNPLSTPTASSAPSPSFSALSPPSSPLKGLKLSDQNSSEQQQQLETLNQNQKELRAKIVNLEFDLREKEKLIKQQEEQLQQRVQVSGNKANGEEETRVIASLQNELKQVRSEVLSLQSEKEINLDKLKSLQKEKEELQRDLELANQRVLDSSDSLTRLAEEESLKSRHANTEKETEKQQLLSQIHQLESSLVDSQRKCDEFSQRIQAMEATKEEEMQKQKEMLEKSRQENIDLQRRLNELIEEVERQKVEVKELVDCKEQLQRELSEKDKSISAGKASVDETVAHHQSELASLRSKYESELQELKELNSRNVSDQITIYQQKIEELAAQNRSLEESKKALLEQTNSDFEKRLAQQSESSSQEKEILLKQHTVELESLKSKKEEEINSLRASLSSQIDELNQKIEALQLLQVQLSEEHQKDLAEKLHTQSQELSAQHEAKLSAAMDSAKKRFEEEKTNELTAQRSQLVERHQTEKEELTKNHQQDLESKLAQQKESYEQEKRTEIERLSTAKDEEKKNALSDLASSLQQEKDLALKTLADQSERDQADLQLRLEQSFNSQIQALETQHQAIVASLRDEITSLRSELASIESNHRAIVEQTIQAKEKEKQEAIDRALAQLRAEMQQMISQANAERDEHLANYTKERKLRKKIHNKLLELQGNIRVICRVRPILEVERRSGEDVDVTEIPNDEELLVQRDAQTKTKFEYDRVFGQGSTQEEVFEAVQPLCVSVLDGYNVCIFAYGQTGSGKTYTMEGYGNNKGVSPRAINELFQQIESTKETSSYTLSLSMLEIYNESIRDLLDSSHAREKEKLDIRQTPEGNQVIGLTEIVITSPEQVKDLMKLGQANRAVGSHDMNEHSSRSHSILTVTCRGINKLDNSTTFGKLHLIDLAGSERVSKTDATGDRLKEAQNINKSLSCLGDVISALGNKKATHVPYRNSKLTFLLQDSLGGNSKVLTFVNISPAIYNLGETICSLNFASRCRSTELGQAKRQTGTASSGGGGDNESVSSMSSSTKSLKKPLTSSASMASLASPAFRK